MRMQKWNEHLQHDRVERSNWVEVINIHHPPPANNEGIPFFPQTADFSRCTGAGCLSAVLYYCMYLLYVLTVHALQ